jgi:hypothetical protein
MARPMRRGQIVTEVNMHRAMQGEVAVLHALVPEIVTVSWRSDTGVVIGDVLALMLFKIMNCRIQGVEDGHLS